MIKTFPLVFCPSVLLSPPCLDARTGPPTAAAAVVSAVSVLRPAGVGGRLAFVAVKESGRDDHNGPQEEDAVERQQTTPSTRRIVVEKEKQGFKLDDGEAPSVSST